MNYITRFLIIIAFVISAGCNKEEYFEGKDSIFENFENVTNSADLLETDNWAYYQQTESNSYIEIDNTNPHTGNNCLKIFAAKGTVSKSDLANNKMAFWENDIVQLSAWFYIEGENKLNYLFLFDIEEQVAIGAGPGIRIAIDDEGYLLVERNKYGESTIRQPVESKTIFPRNQWVNLKLEIDLQQSKMGYLKLWLDDALLIDAENIQTLPKDELYFIQGTKGMYQSVQIGVTATTSDYDVTMYIDDIEIKTL